MKTIKQVSDLTGISVRMLHHYDKIGLLNPTSITKTGYRLYDDGALEFLQQILFFKELEIPLKNMREILDSPQYNKVQALQEQKKLLLMKRNRLNELIALIDKKLEGGHPMSFKEFDMSEYFQTLETFKKEHAEEISKYWGSVEEFEKNLITMKSKELEIAKMAIKEFGSIDKYIASMKKNLTNLPAIMENVEYVKENINDFLTPLNEITQQLVSDLGKDPCSTEVQNIVKQMDEIVKAQNEFLNVSMGENYWGFMAEQYLTKPEYRKVNDKKYGKGATLFMGEALKCYSETPNT